MMKAFYVGDRVGITKLDNTDHNILKIGMTGEIISIRYIENLYTIDFNIEGVTRGYRLFGYQIKLVKPIEDTDDVLDRAVVAQKLFKKMYNEDKGIIAVREDVVQMTAVRFEKHFTKYEVESPTDDGYAYLTAEYKGVNFMALKWKGGNDD